MSDNKSVSKSLIMNLDVFVIQYYCESIGFNDSMAMTMADERLTEG